MYSLVCGVSKLKEIRETIDRSGDESIWGGDAGTSSSGLFIYQHGLGIILDGYFRHCHRSK